MNKTMFLPHLLLFLPCSFLFPLFSFILEYLRAAVRLGWICFLLFHLRFPEFYSLIILLKNPKKYSFSINSRKIFLNFYVKNGAERHLGDLRGTHQTTSPPGGAAKAWSRPPMLRAPPASHLSLHPHFFLSPEISQHPSSNPCSCCSPS
jgi:hypothetical protein